MSEENCPHPKLFDRQLRNALLSLFYLCKFACHKQGTSDTVGTSH